MNYQPMAKLLCVLLSLKSRTSSKYAILIFVAYGLLSFGVSSEIIYLFRCTLYY
jgi:hypothetical protein